MFFDKILNKKTIDGTYTIKPRTVEGKKNKTIESSNERKSSAIDSWSGPYLPVINFFNQSIILTSMSRIATVNSD
ncbi:MAG TPA: hypothetical protein VIK78_10175 [Ruminiclostridium sp.]